MREITTEDVRVGYAVSEDNRDPHSHDARYNLTVHVATWVAIRDRAYAEFDFWLAEHDRQVLGRVIMDAPTLATEAAHAVSVSAADVQQALDDLDEIAPVGHTVYVSTADAPEECTDECPGCMTDRIRAVLTATLRITVTDGGEGRG